LLFKFFVIPFHPFAPLIVFSDVLVLNFYYTLPLLSVYFSALIFCKYFYLQYCILFSLLCLFTSHFYGGDCAMECAMIIEIKKSEARKSQKKPRKD